MYDLVIVGAGPGGIALAAEARAAGIESVITAFNSAVRAMKYLRS